MTRKCLGCSTVLFEGGRRPRCPRCWADRERARNRAKVRAFRKRVNDYRPYLEGTKGPHLPTGNDLEWLDWLNLGLAEPVWNLCEAIRRGSAPYHEEVRNLDRIALERYDSVREEFEARAAQAPQVANLWGQWRAFFEQLREAIR